jgi:thiamine kinase-like enzyme
MPRANNYKKQVTNAKAPAPPPTEGEDITKRYFQVITGLENIDQNDANAQKKLVKKALTGWRFLPEEKITIQNLSGMGPSRTYLLSCLDGLPEKVIVHNKNLSIEDHAHMEAERRQEHIVSLLSDQDATPGRLAEGESWYIEPCAGTEFVPSEENVNAVADLAAKFHKTDTAWFQNFRGKMIHKYPALKKYPYGDPVMYKVVNVDCQQLIPMLDKIQEYPIEPESEVGRRVTTIHGDFHSGNMLIRPSGQLIAIDLELTYVGWAVIDLGYYLEQSCISRAGHREFASRYLQMSNLPHDSNSVDDLLYDIEIGKFMCP